MKLKVATATVMEFAANCNCNCSSCCSEVKVKASPDEALTESTKDAAPAKIDLQAVLLITHDNCLTQKLSTL